MTSTPAQVAQPCHPVSPPDPGNIAVALQLASTHGWAVFPLRPDSGTPYGNKDVAAALGIPEPPTGDGGCYLARSDEPSVRAMWARFPNAAIGIATGKASGIYVLDIDRKHGKDGFAAMKAKGWEPPETWWCDTRSGGRHYYYSIPRDDPRRWSTDAGTLGAGIDRKGDGGYVRFYGAAYGHNGNAPMVAPPDWMLTGGGHGGQDHQPLGSMPAPSIDAATTVLFSIDPNECDRDDWRNVSWAFRQAATGLADDAAVRAAWDAWCTRFTRDDGNDLADNAKLWRSADNGTALGWSYLLSKAAPEVRAALTFNVPAGAGGEVVPVAAGGEVVAYELPEGCDTTGAPSHLDVVRQCRDWRVPVGHDTFAEQLVAYGALPGEVRVRCPRPLVRRDYTTIRIAFNAIGLKPSAEAIRDGVDYWAGMNPFNPVTDWLDGLRWDGIARLDGWLSNYMGALPGGWPSIAGRRFLVGMVARAMEPGVKMDNSLVWESPQGAGKSTAARILAGEEHFADRLPNLHDKEALLHIQGKWLVEISELAALRKSEVEDVKAFLSATTDRYRAPYDTAPLDHPRRTVFIATTNEMTYLKDPTGDRRWWPVRCGTIDIEALTRDRNQLFAEAVHLYRAGEQWWLTPDESRIARIEQAKRRKVSAWFDAVESYCAAAGDGAVKMEELFIAANLPLLELNNPKYTGAIAGDLALLGWQQERDPKTRERYYKRIAPTTSDH